MDSIGGSAVLKPKAAREGMATGSLERVCSFVEVTAAEAGLFGGSVGEGSACRVMIQIKRDGEQPLGLIRLQSIDERRTLVSFIAEYPLMCLGSEARRAYWSFAEFLVDRLVQVGFLGHAELPKEPLGFARRGAEGGCR